MPERTGRKVRATPRRDVGRRGPAVGPLTLAVAAVAAVAVLGLVISLATRDPARDEFVRTWAPRIDAFNEDHPLEGHGDVFAAAAYDHGIDPRYSPAIARVESGSGDHCFLPHNAWGWGSESWPDWDTAIRAHVEGLSWGYGPTLSYEDARRYNPETTAEWYEQVGMCMEQIWPDDQL